MALSIFLLVITLAGCANGAPKSGKALINAIEEGAANKVKTLLITGADANAKSASGETALALAVKKGNVEIIGTIMEHNGNKIDSGNLKGSIDLAIEMGNMEALKLLLDYAENNLADDDYIDFYEKAVDKNQDFGRSFSWAHLESILAKAVEREDHELIIRLLNKGIEPSDVETLFGIFAAVEPKFYPEFDHSSAKELAVLGENLLGALWMGGFSDTEDPNVMINGREYVYMSRQIDTHEHVMKYLAPAYIKEHCMNLADWWMDEAEVHNGRKIMPSGTGAGDASSWRESRLKLIFESEDGKRRRYLFAVPVGEDSIEAEIVDMSLTDDGWRLGWPNQD